MLFLYFLITVSPLIAILLFEHAKKVSSYLASSFLALYFTGILYYIDVIPLTNAILFGIHTYVVNKKQLTLKQITSLKNYSLNK